MTEAQKYVCPNCNGLVDYGTKFCPHCGNAFGSWGAPVQSNVTNNVYQSNNVYVPETKSEESIIDMFFSTKGRLNRKATLERIVINTALCRLLMSFIDIESGMIEWGIAIIAYFVLLYSGITVFIRRWHDLNKSGWYILSHILILPVFYVWLAKGTTGPNKYGPDPLARKN